MNSLFKVVLISGCLVALARVQAGTLARFHVESGGPNPVDYGDMIVELYDEEKPVTVKNFKRLVKAGVYSNMFFHRAVNNFVVQGGGMKSLNRDTTNVFSAYNSLPSYGPIVNEYSVGPQISNTYGTLAMARVGGQTNSATSQFFFNLNSNAFLNSADGGFTVFGKVLTGTNVLEHFRNLFLLNGIVNLTWFYTNASASLFAELPVTYSGFFPPNYNELYYVDISILELGATNSGPTPTFKWVSDPGVTTHLEKAVIVDPNLGTSDWAPISEVVGDGSNVTLTVTNVEPYALFRLRSDISDE